MRVKFYTLRRFAPRPEGFVKWLKAGDRPEACGYPYRIPYDQCDRCYAGASVYWESGGVVVYAQSYLNWNVHIPHDPPGFQSFLAEVARTAANVLGWPAPHDQRGPVVLSNVQG